jgi:septum formation inhibitor MinC
MSDNKILNKVRSLLGMEVKLEQMKLTDGVSILEADGFEAGNEVFIVTEDEQKIPLPVGEYELEDMRVLVVTEEGLIAEIKEAAEEEEEVEVEEPEVEAGKPMEEEMAAEAAPKKTVESIIKETFFSKLEELQAENESLKAELAKQTAQPTESGTYTKTIIRTGHP